MPAFVALLHSIVLGPARRVVMADLRAMAEESGLGHPRTVVATGNLVFEAKRAATGELETRLETAFERRFGKHVDIVVRSAPEWLDLIAGNPFRTESQKNASRVLVRVMREPAEPGILEALKPYLAEGERLTVVERDLWVLFPGRISGSRLFATMTTKRLRAVGTFRNWNTVSRIGELVRH